MEGDLPSILYLDRVAGHGVLCNRLHLWTRWHVSKSYSFRKSTCLVINSNPTNQPFIKSFKREFLALLRERASSAYVIFPTFKLMRDDHVCPNCLVETLHMIPNSNCLPCTVLPSLPFSIKPKKCEVSLSSIVNKNKIDHSRTKTTPHMAILISRLLLDQLLLLWQALRLRLAVEWEP